MPFGLYDGLAIERPFTVRLGLAGEAYAGIRKDRVNVEGRVVIADARGAFGNPTSDSARAMVTDVTTRVLVVLFIPADTPTEQGSAVLQTTRDRFDRFARG